MGGNELIIKTKLETKDFEKEIDYLEKKLHDMESDFKTAKLSPNSNEYKRLQAEIEKTKNKLSSLYQQQYKVNTQGFSNMANSVNGIGNSIEGVIKKIARWGLALFSIRSMYNFIRQSMSTLTQYDDKLAADVEYMRFALANALKPIIEKIIQLAYKLLVYVGYIIKQLFGVNIFANASAKAFEKSKNALSGANKEAKKLQRTLTGIDEMNIIQESGDVTRGGGGGGVTLPTQDLAKMLEEFEPPEWLQKLIDKLKDLKKFLEDNWWWIQEVGKALAIVFGVSKIAGWLGNITSLIGSSAGLTGILGLTAALLTLEAIKQIDITIQMHKQLVEQIENAAEKGEKLIEFEEKRKDLANDTATEQDKLNIIYDSYNRNIKNNTKVLKENIKENKELFESGAILDAMILGENGSYAQNNKVINENTDELKKNIIELYNMRNAGNMTGEQVQQFKEDLVSLIPELEEQRDQLTYGSKEYQNIQSAIDLSREALDKLNINLGDNETLLKKSAKALGVYNGQKLEKKYLNIEIDGDTTKFERKLSNLFSSLKTGANVISMEVNKAISKNAKGAIYFPPKLAVGGIINRPGRGVPIGSAIGGESGAEGVIPLTDSQQMALLGEAIGKYINVNITNVTELDGRTIARKVQEINNNNNFLMNR